MFNLKFNSVNKVSSSKPESAVILFVHEKLSKSEFKNQLDLTTIKFSEKLYRKYSNEDVTSFKYSFHEGNIEYLQIIKLKKDKVTNDTFRNELAGIIKLLEYLKTLFIVIPNYSSIKNLFHSEEYYYQSIFEGVYLGNYNFDLYKSKKKSAKKLEVVLVTKNVSLSKKAIATSNKLMNAVDFTRDLVNEPAITLTPAELAKRTKIELTKQGIKVTVINKKQLKEKKMGAILAVGSASPNDPCMIVMHYKPKVKVKRKIALVGKGVTYDTGGLSIKPTQGMLEMKADMAGGATVIGILKAAAELKLPYEIIGVVPAVENTIAGNAYKPGDVIRTASGKSIEVKDTDAEGRIILADALEFASKQKPDEMFDFATLTGAVAVALGLYSAGMFTKNDNLADLLYETGMRTYERVWRLPFWDDYNKLIDSDIADVSNLGPRWGGAITAGKFLEKFVDEKIPWVHLDIAGTAIENDMNNYTKKWHTGFGVRLMIDYLQNLK
ncbi:MAG: leucyl aminopeptidase [Melioribacteraceae bacterium]|nr:MAG: leucyl aminopeptidase [Melioribacteraceae bacterium]